MGVFRIEEIRDKGNETGLKEGGGVEMSIYSAFHIRDARFSLRLEYLPVFVTRARKGPKEEIKPRVEPNRDKGKAAGCTMNTKYDQDVRTKCVIDMFEVERKELRTNQFRFL